MDPALEICDGVVGSYVPKTWHTKEDFTSLGFIGAKKR
jgi:hypothetical protein